MADCPWCGRSIGVRPVDGVLFKHDNRNNSGFCKGSLMPIADSRVTDNGGTGPS